MRRSMAISVAFVALMAGTACAQNLSPVSDPEPVDRAMPAAESPATEVILEAGPAIVPEGQPAPESIVADIPVEVEYQFLRLVDILSTSIDPEQLPDLAHFASEGPEGETIDPRLLAGAIDLTADQTALQSDPRLVVSAGLYLLSVGHQHDLGARIDALLEEEPRLSAFDLSLMEEAVLVRWNILDALQSVQSIEATDLTDDSGPAIVISEFEADTQALHRAYRFAVFEDQVDRLSEEHLAELEYTLRTYVLGISREVDQETVTSSIRRVDDLNAAAKQQANETLARTLQAIFGFGY